MANPAELPELVKEFADMSKEYLLQETVEPAKQLGRYAGYSFGAALCFALGTLLLTIAGLRWIAHALPDGPNYQALAYLIVVASLGILAGVIVAITGRDSGSSDGDSA